MPKPKTAGKSVVSTVKTPKKSVSAPTPEEQGLKVIYDKLTINEHSSVSEHGPITPDDARLMMGWETEKQYQVRMIRERPDVDPNKWVYGEDSVKYENGMSCPIHCVNTNGEKVVCRHNAGNRPFDDYWGEELRDTILKGQWAGPLTIPGETINGETVRIGRYSRILSGQHQLTAIIWADEFLQKDRNSPGYDPANPKYPFWNGHKYPVIETIVITGLSENELVLRTIDYVKPRTMADVLYTMDLFRKNTQVERKELTRMLAVAVDMLWDRTDTKGYKTHPELVNFLERHKKLLDCVEHIFIENSSKGADGGRKISKLKLSPGQCSAVCYLMSSSGSDDENYGDMYRNMKPAPSEKMLDWSMWDKAREFFVRLAGGRSFLPVRTVLEDVLKSNINNEENIGLGGRNNEKLAILSKAWEIWKDHPGLNGDDGDAGPPFDESDTRDEGRLCLSYTDLDAKGNVMPNGKIELIDENNFGGIDCLEASKSGRSSTKESPMPIPATREEIEKAKEDANKRHGILSPEELRKQNEEAELDRKREEQKQRLLAARSKKK